MVLELIDNEFNGAVAPWTEGEDDYLSQMLTTKSKVILGVWVLHVRKLRNNMTN